MKNLLKGIWPALLIGTTLGASAQDKPALSTPPVTQKNETTETQEIIIRKKGDKDAVLHLQIEGDKVMVNGKPLVEFDDSTISINNRKIIINKNKIKSAIDDFETHFEIFSDDEGDKKAFLGVNTGEAENGVLVESVLKKSAAEEAGLKQSDIIYKINDKKVSTTSELTEAIREKKHGDEITVYFRRDGKEKTAKAKLKGAALQQFRTFGYRMPNGDAKTFSFPQMPAMPDMPDMPDFNIKPFEGRPFYGRNQKLGLKIQDTEDEKGVKVLGVQPDLAAERAGIKKDDIIVEVNGKKILTTDDARAELSKLEEGKEAPVKVKRGGSLLTFNVKNMKPLKTMNL